MFFRLLLCFALPLAAVAGVLTEWRLDLGSLLNERRDRENVDFLSFPGHYGGYFSLNGTEDGHMFYMFFENRVQDPDAPLMLWSNGGPGCTSTYGLFKENGPYVIQEDLSLDWNPYGWDLAYNIIFADHPLNVGYSYGAASDWVTSEEQVSEHLLQFFFSFFDAHPEMQKKPLYLVGESFAGHYFPVFVSWITRSNAATPKYMIDLRGLALVDPWISPSVQFQSYPLYEYSKGLIDKKKKEEMLEQWKFCDYDLKMCDPSNPSYSRDVCITGYNFCNDLLFYPIFESYPDINYYNIKKNCSIVDCENLTLLNTFMNLPEVKQMFNISSDLEYKDCSDPVYFALLWDNSRDYAFHIEQMLDRGIRVLIVVGDDDLICNHIGNRAWVDRLNWTGSEGWKRMKDKDWTVNDTKAGEVKTFEGLTFIRIFDSGHMVPADQPNAAFIMIQAFTNGTGDWEAASTVEDIDIHTRPSITAMQY